MFDALRDSTKSMQIKRYRWRDQWAVPIGNSQPIIVNRSAHWALRLTILAFRMSNSGWITEDLDPRYIQPAYGHQIVDSTTLMSNWHCQLAHSTGMNSPIVRQRSRDSCCGSILLLLFWLNPGNSGRHAQAQPGLARSLILDATAQDRFKQFCPGISEYLLQWGSIIYFSITHRHTSLSSLFCWLILMTIY